MVQKIHGEARLLSNNDEYLSNKEKKVNHQIDLYKSMESLTAFELLEIATSAKNKQQREFAVYLLGLNNQSNHKIKSILWEISSYDHSSIRKTAYWSLAKLNEKKVIPNLLELLSADISEYDKSVTINLLGKIGDESVIRPLVIVSSTTKDRTLISAGMAIHQITRRIGIEPLLDLLRDQEQEIRQETIWLLSSRARFLSKTTERKEILEALTNHLQLEKDISTKSILAFNLSTLNIIEGSKELLLLCLANKISEDLASTYWNEVVRAFVYRQKEISLKLVDKSIQVITNSQSQNKESKQTKRNLLKLKKSLKKLDKIFEVI
ncbi:MAG: HEAT repeat domain-containing protein [Asgard group archaeon]|nr:HEAT repeat domain-containing protein [Asgard group archaeon]